MEDLHRLRSPLRVFVEQECLLGPDLVVSTETLRSAYRQWCEARNDRYVLPPEVFGVKLREIDPRIDNTKRRLGGRNVRHYKGISLKGQSTQTAF